MYRQTGMLTGRLLPTCRDANAFSRSPPPMKPDIVVWCTERKVVYLVELTVPPEDNIEAASIRKNDRYELLIEECEEAESNTLFR